MERVHLPHAAGAARPPHDRPITAPHMPQRNSNNTRTGGGARAVRRVLRSLKLKLRPAACVC